MLIIRFKRLGVLDDMIIDKHRILIPKAKVSDYQSIQKDLSENTKTDRLYPATEEGDSLCIDTGVWKSSPANQKMSECKLGVTSHNRKGPSRETFNSPFWRPSRNLSGQNVPPQSAETDLTLISIIIEKSYK